MLIKEYQILLPLTVDEYRIAQLYMIQKKSRLDSSGAGSGVEIITNEPYTNGPGGSGQYTFKIYHIGNKIPAWIRSVLPPNALEAHEEAWNAYPFTRTRFTCPLMDRFLVEVETRYVNDAGTTENVFKLSENELKNRTVDVMDFVNDSMSYHDYCVEEDPKVYKSEKTGRGPLSNNWVEKNLLKNRPVMCAYKLCRVEFRYWGLQTRAERWIHDLALRGTMLRAHRQAWAWQDEWVDLTMADIRRLEKDAALYLFNVMSSKSGNDTTYSSPNFNEQRKRIKSLASSFNDETCNSTKPFCNDAIKYDAESEDENNGLFSSSGSKNSKAKMSMSKDYNNELDSNLEDVFFDCYDQWCVKNELNETDKVEKPSLIRWSSELLLGAGEEDGEAPILFTPKPNPNSSLLVLVFHGDIFPNNPADTKATDANALSATLENIVKIHYSQLKDRVHVLQVTCGKELASTFTKLKDVCSHFNAFHPSFSLLLVSNQQAFNEAVQEAIRRANDVVQEFLSSETGASFQNAEIFAVGDCVGGLLMYEALKKLPNSCETPTKVHQQVARNYSSVSAHSGYQHQGTLKKHHPSTCSLFDYGIDEGVAMLAFPSVLKPSNDSNFSASFNCNTETSLSKKFILQKTAIAEKNIRNLSEPPSMSLRSSTSVARLSTSSMEANENWRFCRSLTLSFKPNTVFLLGCPLALVLMQRKLSGNELHELQCDQLFNLYYPLDLCASRLEPVLNSQLAALPAMNLPRYHCSKTAGANNSRQQLFFDNVLETPMMWGKRRVDYQLYCPSKMVSLPSSALPNILHASYWESKDVGEFILRQFSRIDATEFPDSQCSMDVEKKFAMDCEVPKKSWNRRRTRFKIANLSANHRSNDLIVVEHSKQGFINARFCYGPMDLVALSCENILVYVCVFGGKWFLNSEEVTDAHGRVTVHLNQILPVGIHAVRMIVKGDHSFLNMYVAVVQPETECVVFSIDGSLTGSVSVTGRDPRVKPGAVDVVSYWHQQNYLIIYVTARPDMQQRFVAHWLAQHNFPHGLLFFTPSISTDPLRQKAQLLRNLTDQKLKIHAAYGSAKDVSVYAAVGVEAERIFKVGGHLTSKKRCNDCVTLESGYAHHLHLIYSDEVGIADQLTLSQANNLGGRNETSNRDENGRNTVSAQNLASFTLRNLIQQTGSFTPRSGKYSSLNTSSKKGSQISISTR